jgi:hypothetical protein
MMHVKRVPIIHARALQVTVSNRETQRMDQMQTRTSQCAHPTNIPRVLGDLGLKKRNMQHSLGKLNDDT